MLFSYNKKLINLFHSALIGKSQNSALLVRVFPVMILLLANKKYVEVVSLLVILLVVMEYWQFHDQ